MYRFLLTPGWLARLAAALAIAGVMVLLGAWQLSRYEERSAVNARIDAAEVEQAVPLGEVLATPTTGAVGPAVPAADTWTMVTATGRYDPAHELLARGRTVEGRVGFEVLTPLMLADGSAILVDRGWVPPAEAGLTAAPEVPAPPGGQVTVTGRVRPGESGSDAPVERHDGVPQTRRINLESVAAELPYPLYGAYLTVDTQQPPADPGLAPIPVRRENAWLNAGYTVQWWLFAAMVLAGFAWLAKRQAAGGADPVRSGS